MKTQMVRVAEIADQVRGVTYSKEDASKARRPGTVAVLRAGNIADFELAYDDLVFVPESCVSARQMLRQNDVVVATSSGSLDVVGKAAQVRGAFRGSFGAFCKVLRPRDEVHPRYFAYFFRTQEYRRRVSELAAGANINNLRNEHLDEFEIPLPPLSEQRRIAAILDEADAMCRKRREAVGLLDDLLRSAFLKMFGDPVTNSRGWPRRALRTVISAIDAGWSSSGIERPAFPGEWGVLKVSAVSTGQFLAGENKAVEAPAFAKPPIVPRRGDLLFSRANTRELVAATCLVDADVDGLYLPDKLWRISCFADVAVVEWLRFLLADGAFRATLTKHATGTSGSMLNVSQDKLLDLVAPIPPLADQRRFATLVRATMDERRRVAGAVDAADALSDSLLHRAFTGAL